MIGVVLGECKIGERPTIVLVVHVSLEDVRRIR